MKRNLHLIALMLIAIMLCALNGMAATTTTVKLYAGTAATVGGIATSAEQFIGTGAWKNNQAAPLGKMELYLPLASLGVFKIDDIANLQFSTKKMAPAGSNVDFFWSIYTAPYVGGFASWYGQRLTSEPMYYNGFNAPYGSWTTFQTPAGANQMTFFDSNHSPAGYSGAPTLADVQAGPISFGYTPPYWSAGTGFDFGAQRVALISLSTGSAWNATMLSYLDGIKITLNNGDVLIIDLEDATPTPATTIQNPTEYVTVPGKTCGYYEVPVTAHDFIDIGAVSLVLNYDKLVLQYDGVTVASELSLAQTNSAALLSGSTAGQFRLAYNGPAITLPENSVLFTLRFRLLVPSPVTTSLTWSTVSGECEYASPAGAIVFTSVFTDLTGYVFTDKTVPVITTCPPEATFEGCSTAAITGLAFSLTTVEVTAAQFTAAGGAATDNCGVTYYAYKDVASGACPIVVIRTWTVKDAKGNTITCDQTIKIADTTVPVITAPAATLQIECNNPNAAALITAWLATATATDNCDGTVAVTNNYTTIAMTCNNEITVSFNAKDACLNAAVTKTAKIKIIDTTKPVITVPPAALTMECFNAATVAAWAATASALDACAGAVTVTPTYTTPTVNCDQTVTVTFTATDGCSNTETAAKDFTIKHVTAPVVPAHGSSTVICPSLAVPPLSGPTNPLVQTPYPDWDLMFRTYANTVLDQQQLSFNNWILNLNTGSGQSFTPAISDKLRQIDVYVYAFVGTPTFSLEVYAGDGKTGTPLYIASGYNVSTTGWISLTIPEASAPLLSSGAKYTFWLTEYPYNSVRLGLGYVNPYAGGISWDEVPTAVAVKDVCGTIIPTPVPVITGTCNPVDGCEGTIIYTYKYMDCAGLWTNWVYTYTVERNDFAMPANTGSSVTCVALATAPAPPAVTDNCGNNIVPAGPVPGESPACNGTKTYTYKYTDCEGNTHDWVYTYTITGVTVSGTVKYLDSNLTPMSVNVTLNPGAISTTTNSSGEYEFTNVCSGNYEVVLGSTRTIVGGINATDAAQVNYWGVSPYPIQKAKFLAGDVDNDLSLLSNDAAAIQGYFLSALTTGFTPPWSFWKAGEAIVANPRAAGNPIITVGCLPVTQDFFGLVTGDFNGSFTGLKSAAQTLFLHYGETTQVANAAEFELPVTSESNLQVGAISMIMDYPSDQVSVEGVYLRNDR
ncbi:MAG: hypothetical protein NTV01_13545, partial [Bacteroidia bacterium]|nr:hypothetical protein [Bacteroidia bacterium]